MLNTFEEIFEFTEMRTLKHEPFFIVGGGGGGGGVYLWYFTHGHFSMESFSVVQ